MLSNLCRAVLFSCLILVPPAAAGKDFFLTIGGGYSPTTNQLSLEKNIQFFQRSLRALNLHGSPHDIYFSDGADAFPDVQVIDRESVPKANRLMAEFFGSDEMLGVSYRNHEIAGVRGPADPERIRHWFNDMGSRMRDGDRLVLYVTSHGFESDDPQNEYNTSIATWDDTSIEMEELVRLLDRLPRGVQVTAIMVQCYSGGFSRFIFNEGDPGKGLSPQLRCGFFATVHDRPAAGCTPEIDEADYVEYSSYFWAALTGRDRTGQAIEVPDYDSNGVVSLNEAHAYTVLTSDTIDLPVTTSSAFLDVHSHFGEGDSRLMTDDEPYERILNLAGPAQAAVLEGLSRELELTGPDRVATARRESQPRRGRRRGRRRGDPAGELRQQIAGDIQDQWPEMANLLNPLSIELLTGRSGEFIRAVEGHPDYARYRSLMADAPPADARQKRTVKYERFLRMADDVVLAENLKRIGDPEKVQQYHAVVRAETGHLTSQPR